MQGKKQERKKIKEMTLCHSCANDYRNSGYILVQKGFQKNKETCDFCNVRRGLTYGIFTKK